MRFLTRHHVGIRASATPDYLADISLTIAEKALTQLHALKPAGDKVQNIVNCCKIVLSP